MNNLPLEEVANIYSGNSINAKLKKDKFTDKNFSTPYVATKDLSKNGDFEYNNGVTIPDTELDNFKIAPKGSTLICMEGGSAGKKIGLLKQDVCFVNKLGALVPNEKINNRYLYYSLQTPEFQAQFKSSLTGIIGGVSLSKLKKLQIPVPSLQEQEKIVERLDKAFANIDSLILKTKKNLEYLSNVFNSELRNLFSHPEDSDPTLGSLSKITSSKRIYKSDYVEEGIPFYRTKEIKELANNQKIKTKLFIDNKKYNELLKNFGVPSKGDILITAIGTIGEIYVVESKDKFYFKDGNIIWIKELKGIEPHYLKYSLMSFINKLNKLSHGAAYNALSIEKLKSVKVKVPSIDEQSQIVSKLNNLKNILNKLVDLNLNKINQLNLLKKSMLHGVFSSESIKEVA